MRRLNMLAFDDFVNGSTTIYTKPELNAALGEHDMLALQAVVDQVNANGNITVQISQSADQINWKNKNATAEINATAITTNTTNVLVGNDAGATPSLGFVRLGITLATTNQAHVKLWVTGRDQS
jgi:hypothetical protein